MKPKLYFGHPINVYDTKLGAWLKEKIAKAFLGWEIEDPSQPQHGEGYQRWKEKTGNGMEYFFQVVLPHCTAGVFLPFRDGRWGAGTYGEAQKLHAQECQIFQITPDGYITQVDINSIQPLTIEETRVRIRDTSGTPIPY